MILPGINLDGLIDAGDASQSMLQTPAGQLRGCVPGTPEQNVLLQGPKRCNIMLYCGLATYILTIQAHQLPCLAIEAVT